MELGEGLGLDADLRFVLDVCLEEVFANLVIHGHAKSATLSLAQTPDVIRLEIEDDGVPFDPTRVPVNRISGPLLETQIGGLGIGLVHQLAPSVTFRRDAGINHLTLEFARTGR
jgi:serine/threonine-protein kinase RsbW